MVVDLLQYLNNTLGLDAALSEWEDSERLPIFLKSGRTFHILSISGTSCLLVACDAKDFNISAFEKQSLKLRQYYSGSIVLSFDRLSSYQRKALIERKIPFIVPDSQIYLPFFGVVLRERASAAVPVVDKLSPASQLVLLHLIYTHGAMNKTMIADKTGVSKMTVTRSVKELLSAGLVVSEKAGNSDYIRTASDGRDIYEAAEPYLINPVQKRIYVRSSDVLDALPFAGLSALSKKTMLNPSGTVCRAVWSRRFSELGDLETVDPDWTTDSCIELEIWKYAPGPLMKHGCVDIISLALSLKDTRDERVEQALDDLLEEYIW